jgi:hypothetical protein
MSEAFGRHLVTDYGIDSKRVRAGQNPIDLTDFRPLVEPFPSAKEPIQIAMVGRLSVRKGLDLVVELSWRLHDLKEQIELDIVGNQSQWSDYRPLLKDLDPAIATYLGPLSRDALKQWLPKCDLLIQPAKYEPFGLTVAEALACGVPVVVTTEVGAGEGLAQDCCTVVPVEDIDALEAAVREMVANLGTSASTSMRASARREAERLWSAQRVALQVRHALVEAAGL